MKEWVVTLDINMGEYEETLFITATNLNKGEGNTLIADGITIECTSPIINIH